MLWIGTRKVAGLMVTTCKHFDLERANRSHHQDGQTTKWPTKPNRVPHIFTGRATSFIFLIIFTLCGGLIKALCEGRVTELAYPTLSYMYGNSVLVLLLQSSTMKLRWWAKYYYTSGLYRTRGMNPYNRFVYLFRISTLAFRESVQNGHQGLFLAEKTGGETWTNIHE